MLIRYVFLDVKGWDETQCPALQEEMQEERNIKTDLATLYRITAHIY